ncbi:MAG: hypothetical protein ACRELT_14850, partial [Longimicrobiales bacterium]
ESTEDHEVAICAELHDDFGLDARPIRLDPGGAEPGGNRLLLERGLVDVDVVITTAFHAAEVGVVAHQMGREMVVATVNPALRERIVAVLDRRDIRVVIADAAYAARARTYMRGFTEGVHYHLMLSDDPEARLALAEPDSAMFTRAARRRLGVEEFHLFPAAVPFLSVETAREIVGVMIRTSRAAEGRG